MWNWRGGEGIAASEAWVLAVKASLCNSWSRLGLQPRESVAKFYSTNLHVNTQEAKPQMSARRHTLGKTVPSLAMLSLGLMWPMWLCNICRNLLLIPPPQWPLHAWSEHVIWVPCPPTGDSLEETSHSTAYRASIPKWLTTVTTLMRTWGMFTWQLSSASFSHPHCELYSYLHYHKQYPSLQKALNTLLQHVDDLKAVLLNYLLINWLSCCQVRLLEAESLYWMICLLLRPSWTNHKQL